MERILNNKKIRDWVKIGIVINVLVFLLLTHIGFGLTPPKDPTPIDVYVMWVAWGLTGLNLVIKSISGAFNILFENN